MLQRCLLLTLLCAAVYLTGVNDKSHLVFAKAQGEFPASIVELTIESHGHRMSGLLYQAAGVGPHPTAVILHGYPGNEKNLDVAQALRRAGWNALFFHYRGAWGSEGDFSIINAEQDVQAVLGYLMRAETATELRVNPQQISLVGHSMGGHMAIAGLLDNPAVVCAVSYDGANMGANGKGLFDDPEMGELWREYSDSLFMLNGWSGAKAVAELSQHAARLDLTQRAHKLSNRPVLLIAADTWVVPLDVHIKPLQAALASRGGIDRDTPNPNIEYVLINDDHSFSSNRVLLIEKTTDFLQRACRTAN